MTELVSARLPVPALRLNRLAVLFAALLACVFLGVAYTAIEHEREHMSHVLADSAERESRWIGMLVTQGLDAALRQDPSRPSARRVGALEHGVRMAVDREIARLMPVTPVLTVRLLDAGGAVV